MTTELILLLGLYAFILLGVFMGDNVTTGINSKSNPGTFIKGNSKINPSTLT